MRNPLLFSSDLLVKRATTQPFLPAYTPPVVTPQNQIDPQAFWDQLQTYPEDVQRSIYSDMERIQNPARTADFGGVMPAMQHGLTQLGHAAMDRFGGLGNTLANWGWGGGKQNLAPGQGGFDTSDRRRDSALLRLQMAGKDPYYAQELQKRIPGYIQQITRTTNPAAPATAPAPTTPAPGVPTAPTTPAPGVPATPTTTQQSNSRISYSGGEANLNNIPQNAQLQMGAPSGNRISNNRKQQQSDTAVNLVSAPKANAQPWTDPKSKFDPNWTAAQREEYTRAKYGLTTPDEINRSKSMSQVYNPTPAAPTTDRWGRALKPAPLTAGEQYQKDWVSGKFEKDQQTAKINARNQEAEARGQARVKELEAKDPKFFEGLDGPQYKANLLAGKNI